MNNRLMLCALAAVFAAGVRAESLSVLPSPGTILVGDAVEVSVRINGLGLAVAPSLALYDLDLHYNPAVLMLEDVLFGDPVNGDQLELNGVPSIALTGPGVGNSVNAFQVSLNSIAELDSLQLADFILLRAVFRGLAIGDSPLSLTVNSLLDGSAANIAADASATATVSVSDIPEPSTLLLLASAAASAGVLRRRLR